MLERLNRYPPNYTPLLTGIVVAVGLYMGLFGLWVSGVVIANWVWGAVLLLPAVGLILQFGTSRVMYIRLYDLTNWALAATAYGLLIWAVLSIGKEAEFGGYVAFVTAGMLALTAVVTGWLTYRNPLRKVIPCAPNGRLDPRTGWVTDLFYAHRADRRNTVSGPLPSWVLRLAPLTAGLAMALVRGLPDSTELLVLLFPGVLFSAIAAMAAGASCSYLIATWRWEQEHGKQIHIRRR